MNMLDKIEFKKNIIFKRIFFLIMLLIMFFIIFGFSSQNGEVSGRLSLRVTKFIVDHFMIFNNLDNVSRWHYIKILHPIIRKLAHFTLYSLVGFFGMGFCCTFDKKNKYKFLWSTLIGVFYAFTDELHQSFITGRGASIIDVGIDCAGVITGIIIMILFKKLFKK